VGGVPPSCIMPKKLGVTPVVVVAYQVFVGMVASYALVVHPRECVSAGWLVGDLRRIVGPHIAAAHVVGMFLPRRHCADVADAESRSAAKLIERAHSGNRRSAVHRIICVIWIAPAGITDAALAALATVSAAYPRHHALPAVTVKLVTVTVCPDVMLLLFSTRSVIAPWTWQTAEPS
jgi:hypothetical protein